MSTVKNCEICSALSTVFLTQIIDGKTTKVSLCSKCARERGVLDPSAFDLAEKLFSSVQGQLMQSPAMSKTSTLDLIHSVSPELSLTKCPMCGFTLEAFRKTGRLGCSRCYDVFTEEIIPSLPEIQTGTNHKGKQPEHAQQAVIESQTRQQMESALRQAINKENFEEAARLRDAIAALPKPPTP